MRVGLWKKALLMEREVCSPLLVTCYGKILLDPIWLLKNMRKW